MPAHLRDAAALPALAASLAIAGPACAADGEWQISPYLWIAGFEGTVGGAGGDSNTGDDADFEHLWENLGLAGAMVNLGWRRARWTAFGDWTYAHVRSESPTRVPSLYDSVEAGIKGHIVQAFLGYDLRPREDGHVDLFAGARYYNLDLEIDFAGAALPSAELQGDADWSDVVAGVRWVTRFAGQWQGYLQADAGTGGSDLSWQAYGAAGYDFEWGTLFGGWRHLEVEYDQGSYQLDVALTGPFLGALFAF